MLMALGVGKVAVHQAPAGRTAKSRKLFGCFLEASSMSLDIRIKKRKTAWTLPRLVWGFSFLITNSCDAFAEFDAGFSCGGVALSLGLCEGFANTTGWEMLELTFGIEH